MARPGGQDQPIGARVEPPPAAGDDGGEAGRSGRLARALASYFIVALIACEAWAIVGYHDDWPFAVNAMFSFHRAPNQPVYDVYIVASGSGSSRRLDPVADLGAPNVESFRRMFFARWYGSTRNDFPQRGVSHDNHARFVGRMEAFCRAAVTEMVVRGERPPQTLTVEMDRLQRAAGTWVATDHDVVYTYVVGRGVDELRSGAG
jgi:hypothetical protein